MQQNGRLCVKRFTRCFGAVLLCAPNLTSGIYSWIYLMAVCGVKVGFCQSVRTWIVQQNTKGVMWPRRHRHFVDFVLQWLQTAARGLSGETWKYLRGIVCQKMSILLFTPLHFVPVLYDWFSSWSPFTSMLFSYNKGEWWPSCHVLRSSQESESYRVWTTWRWIMTEFHMLSELFL